MKFLERWKHLSRHKESYERGRLWDNINSPGGVKPPQTSVSTSNSVQARTQAYTPGPNVEYYLKTTESKNPFRHSTSFNQLQPRISVREPWAVSSTYIQNTGKGQTGLPQTTDVHTGTFIAQIKALAPPMTRQRDNLYDAANSKTLQRMTFITPSQQYFNERTPIVDFVAPSYYSNQVTTNMYPGQPGWSQMYVPEPGMRPDTVGASPPYQLSTPLNVHTLIQDNSIRAKVTGAKAPKRKRTG
jgi:hypothetical protein